MSKNTAVQQKEWRTPRWRELLGAELARVLAFGKIAAVEAPDGAAARALTSQAPEAEIEPGEKNK